MSEQPTCVFCGAIATRDRDGAILAWHVSRGMVMAAPSHEHETIDGEE